MEHIFTFNDINSSDFGVWISGGGTYNAPAKDVSVQAIPGRNGTITFDNGRFENIVLTYPAFISRKFQHRIGDFRAALASQVGYHRLEDTYHPDEFRLAMFKSGLDVTTTTRNLAGYFDIVFDCKPQRFLKFGETETSWESGSIIYNPTRFEALPLIKATGNGTLTLNGTEMTVTDNDSYIMIDCDLQDAYRDGVNCNNMITYDFPTLSPGDNELTYSGFTSIEITPRFWTI